MDKAAVIFGKPIVGRLETLQYASEKFGWKDTSIGISQRYGLMAWLYGRLTKRKVIYYCIDFYSPLIADGFWDLIFIWLAMIADKFLVKVVDEVWDISDRINEGRQEFGDYFADSMIVPLSYPPYYLRWKRGDKNRVVFTGLRPYGTELIDCEWVGKGELPLNELLTELSKCGIGIALWKEKGNNYYGDPGKLKLYSACGLPVITTDNSPYAKIIMDTEAGIVVDYDKKSVEYAVKMIQDNFAFYKRNIFKTWRYINADEIFRNIRVLGK